MFGLLAGGLGGGFGTLLGGGLGFLGNRMASNQAADITNAGLAAQTGSQELNAMLGREITKANIARGIGQTVTDYGSGADIEKGRQQDAFKFAATTGRDLKRGADSADFQTLLGQLESPMYREAKGRQFQRELGRIKAKARAPYEGLFGEIS